MYKVNDIREYKKSLRSHYREKRREITGKEREQLDSNIFGRVTKLAQYRECKQIFCYVSVRDEVDTRRLITQALADGKRVAVPRCVPNTRRMEFYYINSLSQLEPGSFGVDEPLPSKQTLATDFSDSICIVPGICFDRQGYRLGYGMGYYDRFLCTYDGLTVGLCYSACIKYSLIHGKFDRRSDIVITEKYVNRTYL